MKLIDLTLPLYNGQPPGYAHMGFRAHSLWPESFKATETMSYEPAGMRFHVYTVFCEPGTRFILASFRKDFKNEATLDTVDLNKLIMRDTVILDIPKGDDEIIEADELEAAFKKAPYKKGDALLIRSGWGDNQKYFTMGRLWSDNGPHLNAASAERLMDIMQKNGTDMYLYDLCDVAGLDKKKGTRGGFAIRSGMMAVGGIVDAGLITKPRVKLIIAPLKAKGGHMSPCSVVAIEE
ncbi:MAG: cyclase family protein [Chloroflexi bacterium]|nr:cyclase family protein [Chloroflexota bacterium]